MLCVAKNHRLQAHRHCCLTWIFCVNGTGGTMVFRESSETRMLEQSQPG